MQKKVINARLFSCDLPGYLNIISSTVFFPLLFSDFDECSTSDVCENNSTCFNTHGDYVCECTPEYYGQNCNLGGLKTVTSTIYPSVKLILTINNACTLQ